MGKKVAIGTIVGFIVLFGLGALIYMVILKDAMAEMAAAAGDCMSSEPNMVHIALATLAQALLLSAVLYRFGVNTFSTGLVAGGWIMLLISFWYNIWFLAMPWYNTNMMIKDTVMGTVMGLITGGIIGWVYGKVK